MNPKKTSSSINLDTLGETYKLPIEVLNSAVEAVNLSSSLEFMFNHIKDEEYYVYLHFFDFLPNSNQKRIMNISINGPDGVTEPLTLAYQKPTTNVMHIEKGKGIDNILIEATSDSELPAMLNAFEIYRVIPATLATQQDDVDAIWNIRDIYNISRIDWQGDPCGPTGFRWEGLTCGGANIQRIISLNLSSSKLSGRIDAAFSKLTNLEILDLSNNELTGDLPGFLAQLPRLKILNLSRNNLTGLIPESLKEKSNSSLKLSLDGNLGLCQTGSCKSNKKKMECYTNCINSSSNSCSPRNSFRCCGDLEI